MATDDINVVDPDNGSGTIYTSLNLWEDGEDGDLVSSDIVAIAKCRCTGGTADTTAVTIDGWTTDATRYIKIWTDPAESYRHEGVWPSSGNIYRILTTNENAITIMDNYVNIIGIAAKLYSTGSNKCVSYPTAGLVGLLINKCYLAVDVESPTGDACTCFYADRRDQSYEIRNTMGVSQVTNYNHYVACVFADAQGVNSGYTKSFYNCTAIGGYRGFAISATYTAGAINIRNCLTSGFYLEGFVLGSYSSGTISHNASTDTTAPGTDSRDEQEFTFAQAGDYHLASDDAGALGYGVNLSALGWQDDIDGETRPSSGAWCIGADEYVAAATDATCLLDGFLRIIREDTDLLDGKVAVQSKATKLLDGKAVVLSKATNLLDGKTIIKDTTTNLLDGKVTIKGTVSRLLDGKVIIKSSATNLLDGKLFIQSSATKLLDGKVVVKDTTTNLLDGLVIVSSGGDAVKALDGKLNIVKTTTTLLDGKVVIQYTAEDLLDGKLVVKDTTTNLLDGKAVISNLSTSNLDGIVTIKDTTTNSLDGKVVIKDIATRLLDGKVTVITGTTVTLDGKVVVKSETSTVVDGKVVVKDTTTTLLDGALFVTTGEDTDLLDGKVSIIKTRPNHLTNAQVKALIEGITHKDPVPQSSAIGVKLKSKSGKQSNTATVTIEPDE